MKAEIWEIKLYYSLYDVVCNRQYILRELYIPDLDYSFNFAFDSVHAFRYNKIRYESTYSKNWCRRIVPRLVTTIKLNDDQIQLYKKVIKKLKNK
jgi:hypothetical protein